MSDLFGPGSVTDAVRKSEFDWADWGDEPECSDTLAGPIAYDPQRYDEYPGWEHQDEEAVLVELTVAVKRATQAIQSYLNMYDSGTATDEDIEYLRNALQDVTKVRA